jgi:hypothetical protein
MAIWINGLGLLFLAAVGNVSIPMTKTNTAKIFTFFMVPPVHILNLFFSNIKSVSRTEFKEFSTPLNPPSDYLFF